MSVFLLFLTFSSGFFSASETALFSLSSMRIRAYQSDADPRKRLIARLVLQPRELLVTVFMLNTLVNILLQNVASHMFGDESGWELKVGVPLILTLIFGEVIPKYIGLQNNITLAYYVVPVINFLQQLLTPIRHFIVAITIPVSRLMFFYLKKEESISKEELQHVLKKSEEHGVLHPDEAELVWGYLNLQDSLVKELMWPREDMLVYDINDPLTKLEHLFIEEGRTRMPVIDKSLDNLMGIITVRAFLLNRKQLTLGRDLLPLLVKPYYIPESTQARTLLRRFEDKQEVLAIVVDEYGSISGLITREDLLETVIGKISDYRDQKPLYTKAGNDEIIASGKLELSEFNELFNTNLESANNMVTIGGWLTEHLGDIPKSGTKCEASGFLFQVLSADPNRVRRLYVRKIGKNRQNHRSIV
jgi:CBS domain containing-hemolysin-like protein